MSDAPSQPTGPMPAIQVRNLVKTYHGKPPVEAVRGIDLTVERGECFGVLGPNGAGKTTTIEILEGLLEPTSGDVEVLGKRWESDGDGIRQAIGISLQDTQLSEKLTVLETVQLFRSFYRDGLKPEEAISKVGLQDKAAARMKTLSGGQKQRVAVATAIAGAPEILFLDEPTTGLDPVSRRDLWDILIRFRTDGGTILLTTHYMDEAERLCDRVAIVDAGQVLAIDSPSALIASLGGDHVVEFALDQNVPAQTFSKLPGVADCRNEEKRFSLSVKEPHLVIPAVLECVATSDRSLTSLTTRQASLEDVFVKLAGHSLEGNEETQAS